VSCKADGWPVDHLQRIKNRKLKKRSKCKTEVIVWMIVCKLNATASVELTETN